MRVPPSGFPPPRAGLAGPGSRPVASTLGPTPCRKPVRRLAARAVQWGWTWAGQVGAIGPDDPEGRRFGAFGRGSVLTFPQGATYNEQYIRIGEGTMVGPARCLTAGMAPGQVMASDPVVRIGDRCVIGRGSHIVGHWSIEIGDDIQTGPYVYVTDQNHTYVDPDEPVGRQWPVEAPVQDRLGQLAGGERRRAAGDDDRRARRRGGRRGGPGRDPGPLRGRRRAGPDRPPLAARPRLGRRA